MISHSAFLLLLTFSVTIGSSSGMPAVKSETDKQNGENHFVFPEIKDGNALEATMNLLRWQKKHHEEIQALFRKICEKNKKYEHYDLLELSCGLKLEIADKLMTNTTKNVTEYMKNSSVSDDFKQEPMTYETARELTDCWKHIDDFITNYVINFDLDVNPETEDMRKPLDAAIREIESYSSYLDTVYEKSGKSRNEEEIFLYPKYGKLMSSKRYK